MNLVLLEVGCVLTMETIQPFFIRFIIFSINLAQSTATVWWQMQEWKLVADRAL